MSLRVLNHVKMAKVTPTQKLVLLCLADCHNAESGRCDPTQAFIMQFSGLSNRAVSTAVIELEKLGIIRRHAINGCRSGYSFPSLSSEPSSQVDGLKPVNVLPKPVNDVHGLDTPTSERPAETSERPAGQPVNVLPKPVNDVHKNREEQGSETEGTGKGMRHSHVNPPTIEQVRQWADALMAPQECADAFWGEMDGRGWLDKSGQAVMNARSAFGPYATRWKSNDAARKTRDALNAKPKPKIKLVC